MIKRCSNCSGRLTFDIESQSIKCSSCENSFDMFEIPETDYTDSNNLDTVTKKMKCNIFICNSCGAEIIINDTESSTFCVYCGNSSIVFSRIDNIKRPDAIIPFKVTREQAEESIRSRLKSGLLIPKEIKNFKIDTLRPIYIPYYISSLECYGSAVILSEHVNQDDRHITCRYLRGGRCTFNKITTDASKKLNDNISEHLEPFNYSGLKTFNENYLLGFYADSADVTPLEAEKTAKIRAIKLFEKNLIDSVGEGKEKRIERRNIKTKKLSEAKYVFLPAWFLTFRYNDHPYTILVNGQTGKIVGGFPWDEALFIGIFASIILVVSIITTFCLYPFLIVDIFWDAPFNVFFSEILSLLIIIYFVFAAGVKRMTKFNDSIKRTSETALVSFVKDRQSAN